jgi:hypothetical protein
MCQFPDGRADIVAQTDVLRLLLRPINVGDPMEPPVAGLLAPPGPPLTYKNNYMAVGAIVGGLVGMTPVCLKFCGGGEASCPVVIASLVVGVVGGTCIGQGCYRCIHRHRPHQL